VISPLHALALLALLAAASPRDTGPASPCAASGRKPVAPVEAFVVAAPVRARDTTLRADICVVSKKGGAKVGSYHGELHFDSTTARVARVEKASGGLRVENTKLAGRVNFAGAAPDGFESGTVLRVTLRLARAGAQPKLHLTMLEVNATDGHSLMNQLVTRP
jgi:hypothetical protein